MSESAVKDVFFESIQGLFDKSKDLQTQLDNIGSKLCVYNPISLSLLSNVLASMGLH
jgi:hypothetical protein